MKLKYIICLALMALLFSGCAWFDDRIGADQKDPGEPAQKNDEALSELVDSDWTIQVDDTIIHSNEYATYKDTLKLNVTKEYGTDCLGTYKGTIYLKVDHQLPADLTGYNYGEHPEQPITFEMVPYNKQDYQAFETKYKQKMDPAALAPLTDQLDGMAQVNTILNGQWKAVISSDGGTVTKDEPLSGDYKIRMAVTGSVVMVDVLFGDHSTAGFQGTLTKHPIQNQ